MRGLGCGCDAKTTYGNSGSFGYPMGPDGVPVSLDLPGYQAVPGTIPGFNAPRDGTSAASGAAPPAGSIASQTLLGCPLWVWALAAGLVLLEGRKR